MNAWAGNWFDLPLAVFDVETTGLNTKDDRIIEIGIVTFLRGERIDIYNRLINPQCAIPKDVVGITGITQQDVDDCPAFAELANEILAQFDNKALVAYNLPFDLSFLNYEFGRVGLPWPPQAPMIDPLVLARELIKSPDKKLGTVAAHLGVSLEGAHRASHDAEATGYVLYKLASKLPPGTQDLIALQQQWDLAFQKDNEWRTRNKKNENGILNVNAIINAQNLSAQHGSSLRTALAYDNECDLFRILYRNI